MWSDVRALCVVVFFIKALLSGVLVEAMACYMDG
jgi:hypothetical protein